MSLLLLQGGFRAAAQGQIWELSDQLLVKASPRIPGTGISQVLEAMGGTELTIIEGIAVRVVSVPPARRDTVLRLLHRHPDIEFAEADALVAPDFTPDDPGYGTQWHLPRIGAPAAWDLTTGSSEVIVAIVDSGVDGTHPDLAGLMMPGWNFYNNNANTADVYGHGTAVAGAAIALGNNGQGIAGVAWQCRIMPIRVSNPAGAATYSALAQGIVYATDHGARVANVSFAGAARSATVQAAAALFFTRGGLTTVSSGNDGTYVDAPDHAAILAVGSTGTTDALSTFSTRGPFVDLSAPGSGIYTTAMGGGYRSVSGTSFAAPVVAGVAALVFSANPALSAAQAEAILLQTAVDLGVAGHDPGFGWGRVSADAAVRAVFPDQPPPADVTPPAVRITSPSDGTVLARIQKIQVAATDASGIARVDWLANGTVIGTAAGNTVGTYRFSWNTSKLPRGTYLLEAIACDLRGNSAVAAGISVRK